MEPATAILLGAGINAGSGVLGSLFSNDTSKRTWNDNYRAQKEFYQNSLQWRVDDAKKAGLHPNVAAGGVASYTPTSYNSGNDFGQVAANVGRAGQSAMNKLADLQLEGQALANQKAALDVQKQEFELFNKVNPTGSELQTNGYFNNTQSVSKDWIDGLTEALGGLGAVQPVIQQIYEMNHANPSAFERKMFSTLHMSISDFHKYGGFVRSDKKASTAGLPSYEFVITDSMPSRMKKQLRAINTALGVYDDRDNVYHQDKQRVYDAKKFLKSLNYDPYSYMAPNY